MQQRVTVIRGACLIAWTISMAAITAVAAPALATSTPTTCEARLAAQYTARHMEMGGGILLRPDGRFYYELSYGALDEVAVGQWACDEDTVFLTSDPVNPPRFHVEHVGEGTPGQLHVALDLPEGVPRQYFGVIVRYADGSLQRRQFDEDGLTIDLSTSVPVSVVPVLEVYELAGDPIQLPAAPGFEVHLRFTPNDLGKVDFSHTPLKRVGDGLLLRRFDSVIRLVRVDR